MELDEKDFWSTMSYENRAIFQLFDRKLYLPVEVYRESLEQVLDKPLTTYEVLDAEQIVGLQEELLDTIMIRKH